MSSVQNWQIKGYLIDSCSCEVACNCHFPSSVPTNDHCTVVMGMHIREGKYGDTKLDGLNVSFVIDTIKGVIWNGGWTAGAILDDKANPAQRTALETIMTGKAGGRAALIVSLISKFVGMEWAPINFHRDDNGWGFSVGNKVKVEAEASKDEYGNITQIVNAPNVESGLGPISAGRNKMSDITAFGFNWNFAGKSSKLEPFDWHGPN